MMKEGLNEALCIPSTPADIAIMFILTITNHCIGRFTRYDFVACDKLTTGLRHELFCVNQTCNSLTTVVYVTKNFV